MCCHFETRELQKQLGTLVSNMQTNFFYFLTYWWVKLFLFLFFLFLVPQHKAARMKIIIINRYYYCYCCCYCILSIITKLYASNIGLTINVQCLQKQWTSGSDNGRRKRIGDVAWKITCHWAFIRTFLHPGCSISLACSRSSAFL